MKRFLTVVLLSMLALAFMATGCAKNNPVAPKATLAEGKLNIVTNLADNMSSGTVTITMGALSFTANLYFTSSGSATASFADLQVGTWNITAKLFDALGTLRYTSTGTVNVVANTPATVTLTQVQVGGPVTIVISFPGSAMIYTGYQGSYALYTRNMSGVETIIPNSQDLYNASTPRSLGGNTFYCNYDIGSPNLGKLCTITSAGVLNVLVDGTATHERFQSCRPSWDGTKIAFFNWGNTGTSNSIGVAQVSGGVVVSRTYFDNGGGYDQWPVWTFDGRIIYSHANYGATTASIYIMNSDGTNKTLIPNTSGLAPDMRPYDCSYSNVILFQRGSGSNASIWKINIDGSGLTQLTSGAYDFAPRWNGIDTQIVYHSTTALGVPAQLYTMNADGSSKTKVSSNPAIGYTFPAFQY